VDAVAQVACFEERKGFLNFVSQSLHFFDLDVSLQLDLLGFLSLLPVSFILP